MTRQHQEAGQGSVAIQSDGDVNLQIGVTGSQLSELMVGVAQLVAENFFKGQSAIEERLSKFREEVLAEVAGSAGPSPAAFADPDFQYAMRKAQEGYVRTEDPDISASLINLISERSRQGGRSRASLSLNSAIEVVSNLTPEDIAVATAVFVTIHALLITHDPNKIIAHLKSHLSRLDGHISERNSSPDYLCSLGCAYKNQLVQMDFFQRMRTQYSCAFADDFSKEELIASIPGVGWERLRPLLIGFGLPSLDFTSGDTSEHGARQQRFKFQQPNAQAVARQAHALGVEATQPLQNFIEQKSWAEERVKQQIIAKAPELGRFAEIWLNLGLGGIVLTPVGVAVAHSNARRLDAEFQAPIGIWIQ